jgi:hypothetical protein
MFAVNFPLSLIVFVICIAQPAFAQVGATSSTQNTIPLISPVKTGDRIFMGFFNYKENPGEVAPARNFTGISPAMLTILPDSYKIMYDAGRVEVFSKEHTLLSRNRNVTPEKYLNRWMPEEGVESIKDGGKWKRSINFSNPRHCDGVIDYDMHSKFQPFVLKINDAEKEVGAIHIKMSGMGYCSNEPSSKWKVYGEVIFSKDLNLVVSKSSYVESIPGKFPLAGGGYVIQSIELAK